MISRPRLAVLIAFIVSIVSYAYAANSTAWLSEPETAPPPIAPIDDHRASSSYQDYRVLANTISIVSNDQRLTATGNVLFQAPNATLWADDATLDFRTRTGELDQAGGVIFPYRLTGISQRRALAPQNVPLRFTAQRMTYAQSEQTLSDTTFTTCTHERPHYDLSAKNVVVRGDGYFDARHVTFRYHGFSLLSAPRVSTDLAGSSIDNLARPAMIVGQSENDGFYIETHLSESLAPNTSITLLARDGQKGLLRDGLIVDHDFTVSPAVQGQLSLALTHHDTPAGRLENSHDIAASGTGDIQVSRLPALTATVNTVHLRGSLTGTTLRASAGYGRYREDATKVSENRYHAWMTVRSPAQPLGDHLLARGEAGVRGVHYGNGTSNTVGAVQVTLETPISAPNAYGNITFRHFSETGTSPFSFDRPAASNEVFTEAELPITPKGDWHVEGWSWYDLDTKRTSSSGATLIYMTDCLSYGVSYAQPLNSFSLGIRLNAFGSFRRGGSSLLFNP
jgi:hypothetical protein